jgi:hypothetical protein
MDVKQILSDAWKAVEGSGVPENLHAVAFEQAVRLIATPMLPEPVGSLTKNAGKKPSGSRSTQTAKVGEERSTESAADPDEFFARFAAESAVEEEKLRTVYMIKDGHVRLSLTKRALGDTEAAKNRTIALLMAAPRWYVDGKQELVVGEVREVAKAIGYEPSRNLSTHLDSVPGTSAVGVKNDKAIRVQGAKFDAPFRELIERLTAD